MKKDTNVKQALLMLQSVKKEMRELVRLNNKVNKIAIAFEKSKK